MYYQLSLTYYIHIMFFFFWSLILVVSVIQNTHPMQWPLCTVHTIIADKETVEH